MDNAPAAASGSAGPTTSAQRKTRLKNCLPRDGLYWFKARGDKGHFFAFGTTQQLTGGFMKAYGQMSTDLVDKELTKLFETAKKLISDNDMASMPLKEWWYKVVWYEAMPKDSALRQKVVKMAAIIELVGKTILARTYVLDKINNNPTYIFAAARNPPCASALAVDDFVLSVKGAYSHNPVVLHNHLRRYTYEENFLFENQDPWAAKHKDYRCTQHLRLTVREYNYFDMTELIGAITVNSQELLAHEYEVDAVIQVFEKVTLNEDGDEGSEAMDLDSD